MAVDVKVIRVYLWRFSVLLAGICFRFAQKHPCIAGTLLSFFFLYVFFPLVFRLLIYSSPIMICAYAYRKNVAKPEHPEARIQKKYDQTNDVKHELDIAKKRRVDFLSHNDGRIDSEKKDNESKKSPQESESDILGKAENDSRKTKEFGKAENGETENDNWSKHNGESESDVLDKAEYEDDEETQEEDAQEEMQKAVEWTEQDERNLMDLGSSETERDKRLESLIQKRRARKLLSMQVRNVIDIIRHPPHQVAPLVIARTGPLNLINTLSDTDDLHMPGSAPSVLLPSRSPFDLPYDPFEERPDLTGDSSFEQEFVPADQKDFCRHESFFLGGHSGSRQDGNSLNSFMNAEKKRTDRQRFSRFRSYIDRGSYESISPGASSVEHDLAVRDLECEQEPSTQTSKTDNEASRGNTKSENSKTEKKEKCDSESLYNDRCRMPGTDGNVEPDSFHSGKIINDNQVESVKTDLDRNLSSEDLSSYLHKSLASSIQHTAAKETKENGHAQAPLYTSSKDLFNVHKRALHTPAHSIASDLVVEVSEAGSPPPTLSPPDEDSSHYDGDVERDLSSGSEDLSLHVYRTEEHGTRSLERQESIPEVVELEEEVIDEYEHTSPTSSDDNSSYENVVNHLNEKLKARRVSNNVILGTQEEPCNPTETGSVVQIENLLSNQTNPMSGASESAEGNERNSTTTDHHEISEVSGPASVESAAINPDNYTEHKPEEVGSPVGEQSSSTMQAAEDVPGNTEIRTSDDLPLAAEQQVQANEEVPEVTSPKSVLPDTDIRDQITRLDSQPSDLADSVSDVPQLENSTSSTSDNQSSQHVEIQDVRSSPLESKNEQETKNEGLDQITKTEATLHPPIAEDNSEPSVTHKTDEAAGDMGVNQVITDEKYVAAAASADKVSEKIEETVSITKEATEENLAELHGDNLVTRVDPVAESNDLKLTKDEKEIVLVNSQAESAEGQSSTETLPLSNILISDDEFNGMSQESRDPDLKGGSSRQNVYTDLTTLGETLTTSASSIDTPGGNVDDTSAKSTEATQNEAPLPDMDTELHIHRITETCM